MKKMTVARYIDQQVTLCGRSQREIAEMCGWLNSNIITMLKRGQTKLPVAKVGVLAEALGVDPRVLLRLAMTEYMPDTWAVLEEIIGTASTVTDDELAIIEFIREVGLGRTPRLDNNASRAELATVIRKLAERDEAKDAAAVERLSAVPRVLRHR